MQVGCDDLVLTVYNVYCCHPRNWETGWGKSSHLPHLLFDLLSSSTIILLKYKISPSPLFLPMPSLSSSVPPSPWPPPLPYCSFCARRQKICLPYTQGCLPVSQSSNCLGKHSFTCTINSNVCVCVCSCVALHVRIVNNTCTCLCVCVCDSASMFARTHPLSWGHTPSCGSQMMDYLHLFLKITRVNWQFSTVHFFLEHNREHAIAWKCVKSFNMFVCVCIVLAYRLHLPHAFSLSR